MKKSKNKIISSILVIAFIFIFCCAINTEKAKGFIWEATKNGKSAYLVGTMHPAKSGIDYENKVLKKIIGETDGLAVELDTTDEKLNNEFTELIDNKHKNSKGELKDLLSKSEQNKLDTILSEFDIPYGDIKNFTPNDFSSLLESLGIMHVDAFGQTTDDYLISKYTDSNRDVVSLETPEIQANYINTAFNTSDKDFKQLINTFDKETYLDEFTKDYNNILDSYISGDETYFVNTSNNDPATDPNLDRNINMSNNIDKLVNSNKKYVVAVGSYHFFGDNSIIKQLEKKGYEIKRLTV